MLTWLSAWTRLVVFSTPTIQSWRGVSSRQECRLWWQAAIQSLIAETIHIVWRWSGWPYYTKSWHFIGWNWKDWGYSEEIMKLRRLGTNHLDHFPRSETRGSFAPSTFTHDDRIHPLIDYAHHDQASRDDRWWTVISHIVWGETCFRTRMNQNRHQSHPASCNHTTSQKYSQYLKAFHIDLSAFARLRVDRVESSRSCFSTFYLIWNVQDLGKLVDLNQGLQPTRIMLG